MKYNVSMAFLGTLCLAIGIGILNGAAWGWIWLGIMWIVVDFLAFMGKR